MEKWVDDLYLDSLNEDLPQNFHRIFYLSSTDIESNLLK